ncbi:Wadjet anti-phage system protein JetD domain-containing protein [Bradyrhizobium paxllaeri]|uniref:Wadjet anti-phage system protein JetD domain-containing protein n=1 Tax=Bradyrhizobium paxllaeri TaxID=190148 RepID=UPI0008108B4C|nr:Wadjet anti-phage system protein JetD domain-containing protein [Bradyrhizobium paxllaeri]
MQHEPAARLIQALKRTGRRRIPLDQLRKEFAAACPELAEQADRRSRLAQLLQSAAASGEIVLPLGKRSWDRTGGMPLPGFVVLAGPTPPRIPAVAPGYSWHPLLGFAASERNRLRLEAARCINEWLKSDPDLSLNVPIKERSLEIFGDEKRLDRLRAGSDHLFGRLSLLSLGCRICPIPLPFEAGPAAALGKPILIVENNDTWVSFSMWNRSAARLSAVAYAGGGHAKSLAYDETFIDELIGRLQAQALYYFGDIDPAGLRIASRAAQRRAWRLALPLQPAPSLYTWLLEHGTRTPLEGNERVADEDLAWLPPDIRSSVTALFASKQRVPQEALGTRVLMSAHVSDWT